MRYLLDTHILIWALTDHPRLDALVKTILADQTSEFYVSTESVRELILKAKLGKLELPLELDTLLFQLQNDYGIHLLTVGPAHLKKLYELQPPASHKDPFDHLLICQAMADQLTIISADRNFPYYRAFGLQLLENLG